MKIDGFQSGDQLIAEVAKRHGQSMLAFSCGKDAIGAWLALRDRMEVIPYYCYLVPDLEFVEESLVYYEGFFKTKIMRLPHQSLHRLINNKVFQPPERLNIIEGCTLADFTRKDLLDEIREFRRMDGDSYCASGVRSADSIMRRMHFIRHGAFNHTEKVWYPIWDWKVDRLRYEINRAGVMLPVDYQMFGRSFDGIDHRFLKQIKNYFPRDYAKILEWFPMAELELKREEFSNATY